MDLRACAYGFDILNNLTNALVALPLFGLSGRDKQNIRAGASGHTPPPLFEAHTLETPLFDEAFLCLCVSGMERP